jgi:hypothetical protein
MKFYPLFVWNSIANLPVFARSNDEAISNNKEIASARNAHRNDASTSVIARNEAISAEATGVMLEAQKLWQAYFAHTDVHTVREELKLNRPDVGWYQVSKALEARNSSGDFPQVSFTVFKDAYNALTEKLQPMVYELGFLKV